MDAYEIVGKIGDGTFGTVYLCRKRSNESGNGSTSDASNSLAKQEMVAVKKMKKRYYNWDECMKLREVRALKKLNHRNIISLKEVIRDNGHLYLVFEHMERNLYQMIRDQLDSFPELTIKHIVYQIANGLAHIHKHGFFHRDIKPENILCRDGGNSIKIADLGLIREIGSLPPFTEYVSTRWYRAPELLLHSTNYNWAVDIWALGCIAGELYTLRPLFPGRSEVDQIFKICQIIGPPDAATWPEGARLASLVQLNFPNVVPLKLAGLLTYCSGYGLNMIDMMLKWVPSQRPNARDLLNHSFLKRYSDSKIRPQLSLSEKAA